MQSEDMGFIVVPPHHSVFWAVREAGTNRTCRFPASGSRTRQDQRRYQSQRSPTGNREMERGYQIGRHQNRL